MKRIIYIFIFSSQLLFGQSANDALQISQGYVTGTARFQAMGGAFTALGGELSSMQINPASGSVFLEGEASISYALSSIDNNATFYNNGGSDNYSYNNINQIGIVFVTENKDYSSSIVKYAFGINYNRTNNYNENISFKGNNNTQKDIYFGNDLMYSGYSSIAASFLLAANGYSPSQLYGAEEIAFNTYLIDMNIPYDPNNPDADYSLYYDSRYPTYSDNFPVYVTSAIPENTLQDYYLNKTGYSGQYSFSASMDINNKLYLGASFNRSTYRSITSITLNESEFATNSEVKEFTYNSYVNTVGSGNGFSIGGILRASEFLRIGLTYHSPTWYRMNDEYNFSLSVINTNFAPEKLKSNTYYSDYKANTPYKINSGIALVFGKNGLISADYEFIDYSSMKLDANFGFEAENNEIKNTMKSTHNLKIGAEWKVSFVSLRGGYAYSQSPYKDIDWQSDTQSFSLGAGLNFKTWNFDVAYQRVIRTYDYYIYESDLVNAANIDRTDGNFVATLRFKM
jgi:hypothetical protein